MHHVSLGETQSPNGALKGGERRRNRRFTVRPSRSNSVPMVLAAGHAPSGRRRSSQARTLTGPQVGCARRTSRQATAIAPSSDQGRRSGARERSTRPASPSAACRDTHL
jgi:hypothetical protein